MRNVQPMKVLNSIEDLIEDLPCCLFLQSNLVRHDAEQFTLLGVLANDEDVIICLDDLVEIDDIGVADFLHDLYLTLDSQLIIGLLDAVLVDYLYCDLLASWNVSALLNLTESALA